ncbi:hypothetical protein AM587_10005822 [Phytophthora nicotianae]|uniref:Uncharacterized protein n=3 Tax=Phytophthora nicotianae TaxID=4792 RepID=A0A0W8D0Q0_PHYNI|nr:hypothetical protein AM587_10005822 [Phytophthora nicotianae]
MIPLDEACLTGSTRLLNRIWESSDPNAEKSTSWSPCQHLRTDVYYCQFQFTKSLRAAVGRGDLGVVKWVLDHFSGCTAGVEVVEEAARHGQLKILQYLLQYGHCGDRAVDTKNIILWGGDDLVNAIAEGHGHMGRWLYENTPDTRRNLETAMSYAVKQGDRPLVQWLIDVVYEAEPLLLPPSMDDAAAGGHMELLQWIYEQGYGGCSGNALEAAAKNGRLDMVQWLVENRVTKGAREGVRAACGEGHLNVVQWLLERVDVQYPHFAMNCAIRQGHLDIVKYLCKVGIVNEPSLMVIDAASNGHVHMIKWFLENYGTEDLFPTVDPSRVGPSSQTVMDRAANNGHLHILELLHSVAVEMQKEGKNGAPTCTNWALESAAIMGHLEVVKWLQTHYTDLCFSSSTTSMVARNGNLKILQWLHRRDDVEWSTDVMDSAAENGHLAVVKWLHVNRSEGCTTSAMNFAAANGHRKVVQWLHFNRTEGCTVDAMDFAVGREHFEVLLFLRANRTEGCTTTAKILAREHKQRHMLEWLEDQYPESG